MLINIAKKLEFSKVEGPHNRMCIWVQGCIHHCEGCCNQSMLPFVNKNVVEIDSLIEWIDDSINKALLRKEPLDGITFLGGEPMLQAEELAILAKHVKSKNLGVMCFTGFIYENLLIHEANGNLKGVSDLLESVDLLIDGKFVKDLLDTTRNWVGSTNQRFIYLTDYYTPEIEQQQDFAQLSEIRIELDNLSINGDPRLKLEGV